MIKFYRFTTIKNPCFIIRVTERKKRNDDFCIGDTKRSKVPLDLIEQFKRSYNNKQHNLVLMHWVENSHDDNTRLTWIDEQLLEFFQNGFKTNLFENTAIFLFSDHGTRFADKRDSNQRYLEERLPFVSLFLPDWFKKMYKEKYENFQLNKNRLTSPFDIHATVRDLTCLESIPKNNPNNTNRAISLFDKISKHRLCDDIGISEHFCSCFEPWEIISKNDNIVRRAIQFSIDSLNKLTEKLRNLCVSLYLKSVISAEKLVKFNKIVYKIQYITSPNNGIYEVLIHRGNFKAFEFKSEFFSIKTRNDISRIDAYGIQPHCVSNFGFNPSDILDLRKFCFCKHKPTRKPYRKT